VEPAIRATTVASVPAKAAAAVATTKRALFGGRCAGAPCGALGGAAMVGFATSTDDAHPIFRHTRSRKKEKRKKKKK
jgi:hypothetical protein